MKKSRGKWFVKRRGSYYPCSWQGWVSYVPFVVYVVTAFVVVNRNSHSMLNTLYGLFPQWVAAAVIMTWVASRKS